MDENMFDLGLDVATISADLPDPVITLSGADSYTVQGTADYPLLALSVYGKSVQGGTPTPDAPIDIVSVGDDGNVSLTTCGKNFVQYSNASTGYGGITFTLNSDNSITVNGTATSLVNSSAMSTALLLPNGDYIVSGCAEGGTSDTYKLTLRMYKSDGTSKYVNVTKETKVTIDDSITKILLYCEIYEGITANNLVFKPMIRPANIADSTYEPYKGNTATITSGLPLCSVGGVRDELIYNADGTGKIIKRTDKKVLVADNIETFFESENGNYFVTTVKGMSGENSDFVPVCSRFVGVPYNERTAEKYINTFRCYSAPDGKIALRNSASDNRFTSLAEMKEYVSANETVVVYPLATPQEIELSADEMAELQKLKSYEGTTSIYNDEQAEMLVKMLRSDYDMKYIEWLKESQTWACPKAGKWKVICVGGGASGGMYEKATGSGATEQTLIATVAGGTTSFGSIVAADGAPSTSDYTTHGYSDENVGVSGYGGYTGVDYGGAPSIGSSTIRQEFGAVVGNKNAGMYAIANPTAALGYGAGGGAVGRFKANYDVSPIPGRAGSIESTIVDLDEGQTIMCTVGKGGQTTDPATMGSGADGVIVVQYLGY